MLNREEDFAEDHEKCENLGWKVEWEKEGGTNRNHFTEEASSKG